MALSKEDFENKCIEVIEKIVLIDYMQTRKGAVAVAEKMLAKTVGKREEIVLIYKRVLEEFQNCSDKEYEILKKQLFEIK